MPRYIRAFVPGGTFFFTLALLERRRRLLTEHIDDLRAVFSDARRRRPFEADWPYSSFHRYVQRGVLPRSWAVDRKIQGLEME